MEDCDLYDEEQQPVLQPIVEDSKSVNSSKRAYALNEEQIEANVLMYKTDSGSHLAEREDDKKHSVTRDKSSRSFGKSTKKISKSVVNKRVSSSKNFLVTGGKNVSEHQKTNNLNVEKRVGKLQVGKLVCLLKLI